MTARFLTGDCLALLPTLAPGSVQTCVTSPPYFGLRSYLEDGHPDKASEIGLERAPQEYVAQMVSVFRGVRNALRDDGTLWLNLGDKHGPGKQLLGIPWRVAFALQAEGWVLRQSIVWNKPSPMPEGGAHDRPTSAHEMLFLLAKAGSYFYDRDAIAETATSQPGRPGSARPQKPSAAGTMLPKGARIRHGLGASTLGTHNGTRNCRNVWTITPQPYAGAHTAPMPLAMAERCIKAGSRPGDLVLDPFGGAGTTALAAQNLGRSSVSIELNPASVALAEERLAKAARPSALPPLFAAMAAENLNIKV